MGNIVIAFIIALVYFEFATDILGLNLFPFQKNRRTSDRRRNDYNLPLVKSQPAKKHLAKF